MSSINKPQVPEGLRDLMKDLTREILKEKPTDIYNFAENYFQSRLPQKENYTVKKFEQTSGKYDFSSITNPYRCQIPVTFVYSIIPEGITELIKDLIKAILREQPDNLCNFALEYFRHLKTANGGEVKTKYGCLSKEINYSAYENYFNNKERYLFTPYVKCTCGRIIGESQLNNYEYKINHFGSIHNYHHVNHRTEIQKQSSEVDGKKKNNVQQLSENENDYSKKYLNSVFIIQRCFRNYLKRKAITAETRTSDQMEKIDSQLHLNPADTEKVPEDASYTSASTALLSAPESGRDNSGLSTAEYNLSTTIVENGETEKNEEHFSTELNRSMNHETLLHNDNQKIDGNGELNKTSEKVLNGEKDTQEPTDIKTNTPIGFEYSNEIPEDKAFEIEKDHITELNDVEPGTTNHKISGYGNRTCEDLNVLGIEDQSNKNDQLYIKDPNKQILDVLETQPLTSAPESKSNDQKKTLLKSSNEDYFKETSEGQQKNGSLVINDISKRNTESQILDSDNNRLTNKDDVPEASINNSSDKIKKEFENDNGDLEKTPQISNNLNVEITMEENDTSSNILSNEIKTSEASMEENNVLKSEKNSKDDEIEEDFDNKKFADDNDLENKRVNSSSNIVSGEIKNSEDLMEDNKILKSEKNFKDKKFDYKKFDDDNNNNGLENKSENSLLNIPSNEIKNSKVSEDENIVLKSEKVSEDDKIEKEFDSKQLANKNDNGDLENKRHSPSPIIPSDEIKSFEVSVEENNAFKSEKAFKGDKIEKKFDNENFSKKNDNDNLQYKRESSPANILGNETKNSEVSVKEKNVLESEKDLKDDKMEKEFDNKSDNGDLENNRQKSSSIIPGDAIKSSEVAVEENKALKSEKGFDNKKIANENNNGDLENNSRSSSPTFPIDELKNSEDSVDESILKSEKGFKADKIEKESDNKKFAGKTDKGDLENELESSSINIPIVKIGNSEVAVEGNNILKSEKVFKDDKMEKESANEGDNDDLENNRQSSSVNIASDAIKNLEVAVEENNIFKPEKVSENESTNEDQYNKHSLAHSKENGNIDNTVIADDPLNLEAEKNDKVKIGNAVNSSDELNNKNFDKSIKKESGMNENQNEVKSSEDTATKQIDFNDPISNLKYEMETENFQQTAISTDNSDLKSTDHEMEVNDQHIKAESEGLKVSTDNQSSADISSLSNTSNSINSNTILKNKIDEWSSTNMKIDKKYENLNTEMHDSGSTNKDKEETLNEALMKDDEKKLYAENSMQYNVNMDEQKTIKNDIMNKKEDTTFESTTTKTPLITTIVLEEGNLDETVGSNQLEGTFNEDQNERKSTENLIDRRPIDDEIVDLRKEKSLESPEHKSGYGLKDTNENSESSNNNDNILVTEEKSTKDFHESINANSEKTSLDKLKFENNLINKNIKFENEDELDTNRDKQAAVKEKEEEGHITNQNELKISNNKTFTTIQKHETNNQNDSKAKFDEIKSEEITKPLNNDDLNKSILYRIFADEQTSLTDNGKEKLEELINMKEENSNEIDKDEPNYSMNESNNEFLNRSFLVKIEAEKQIEKKYHNKPDNLTTEKDESIEEYKENNQENINENMDVEENSTQANQIKMMSTILEKIKSDDGTGEKNGNSKTETNFDSTYNVIDKSSSKTTNKDKNSADKQSDENELKGTNNDNKSNQNQENLDKNNDIEEKESSSQSAFKNDENLSKETNHDNKSDQNQENLDKSKEKESFITNQSEFKSDENESRKTNQEHKSDQNHTNLDKNNGVEEKESSIIIQNEFKTDENILNSTNHDNKFDQNQENMDKNNAVEEEESLITSQSERKAGEDKSKGTNHDNKSNQNLNKNDGAEEKESIIISQSEFKADENVSKGTNHDNKFDENQENLDKNDGVEEKESLITSQREFKADEYVSKGTNYDNKFDQNQENLGQNKDVEEKESSFKSQYEFKTDENDSKVRNQENKSNQNQQNLDKNNAVEEKETSITRQNEFKDDENLPNGKNHDNKSDENQENLDKNNGVEEKESSIKCQNKLKTDENVLKRTNHNNKSDQNQENMNKNKAVEEKESLITSQSAIKAEENESKETNHYYKSNQNLDKNNGVEENESSITSESEFKADENVSKGTDHDNKFDLNQENLDKNNTVKEKESLIKTQSEIKAEEEESKETNHDYKSNQNLDKNNGVEEKESSITSQSEFKADENVSKGTNNDNKFDLNQENLDKNNTVKEKESLIKTQSEIKAEEEESKETNHDYKSNQNFDKNNGVEEKESSITSQSELKTSSNDNNSDELKDETGSGKTKMKSENSSDESTYKNFIRSNLNEIIFDQTKRGNKSEKDDSFELKEANPVCKSDQNRDKNIDKDEKQEPIRSQNVSQASSDGSPPLSPKAQQNNNHDICLPIEEKIKILRTNSKRLLNELEINDCSKSYLDKSYFSTSEKEDSFDLKEHKPESKSNKNIDVEENKATVLNDFINENVNADEIKGETDNFKTETNKANASSINENIFETGVDHNQDKTILEKNKPDEQISLITGNDKTDGIKHESKEDQNQKNIHENIDEKGKRATKINGNESLISNNEEINTSDNYKENDNLHKKNFNNNDNVVEQQTESNELERKSFDLEEKLFHITSENEYRPSSNENLSVITRQKRSSDDLFRNEIDNAESHLNKQTLKEHYNEIRLIDEKMEIATEDESYRSNKNIDAETKIAAKLYEKDNFKTQSKSDTIQELGKSNLIETVENVNPIKTDLNENIADQQINSTIEKHKADEIEYENKPDQNEENTNENINIEQENAIKIKKDNSRNSITEKTIADDIGANTPEHIKEETQTGISTTENKIVKSQDEFNDLNLNMTIMSPYKVLSVALDTKKHTTESDDLKTDICSDEKELSNKDKLNTNPNKINKSDEIQQPNNSKVINSINQTEISAVDDNVDERKRENDIFEANTESVKYQQESFKTNDKLSTEPIENSKTLSSLLDMPHLIQESSSILSDAKANKEVDMKTEMARDMSERKNIYDEKNRDLHETKLQIENNDETNENSKDVFPVCTDTTVNKPQIITLTTKLDEVSHNMRALNERRSPIDDFNTTCKTASVVKHSDDNLLTKDNEKVDLEEENIKAIPSKEEKFTSQTDHRGFKEESFDNKTLDGSLAEIVENDPLQKTDLTVSEAFKNNSKETPTKNLMKIEILTNPSNSDNDASTTKNSSSNKQIKNIENEYQNSSKEHTEDQNNTSSIGKNDDIFSLQQMIKQYKTISDDIKIGSTSKQVKLQKSEQNEDIETQHAKDKIFQESCAKENENISNVIANSEEIAEASKTVIINNCDENMINNYSKIEPNKKSNDKKQKVLKDELTSSKEELKTPSDLLKTAYSENDGIPRDKNLSDKRNIQEEEPSPTTETKSSSQEEHHHKSNEAHSNQSLDALDKKEVTNDQATTLSIGNKTPEYIIGNQNLNIDRIRFYTEGLLGSISGQRFAELHLRSFWKEFLLNNSKPFGQYDREIDETSINQRAILERKSDEIGEKRELHVTNEPILINETFKESEAVQNQSELSHMININKDIERLPRYFYGIPEQIDKDKTSHPKPTNYKKPLAFTIPIGDVNKKPVTKTNEGKDLAKANLNKENEMEFSQEDSNKNSKNLDFTSSVDAAEPLLEAETPTKLFQDINQFEYELHDLDLNINYAIDEILSLKAENDLQNNSDENDENLNDTSEYSLTPEPMLQTIIEVSESETPRPIEESELNHESILINIDKNSNKTTDSRIGDSSISDELLENSEHQTEQLINSNKHFEIKNGYASNKIENINYSNDKTLSHCELMTPNTPNNDKIHGDLKETAAKKIQKTYRQYLQNKTNLKNSKTKNSRTKCDKESDSDNANGKDNIELNDLREDAKLVESTEGSSENIPNKENKTVNCDNQEKSNFNLTVKPYSNIPDSTENVAVENQFHENITKNGNSSEKLEKKIKQFLDKPKSSDERDIKILTTPTTFDSDAFETNNSSKDNLEESIPNKCVENENQKPSKEPTEDRYNSSSIGRNDDISSLQNMIKQYKTLSTDNKIGKISKQLELHKSKQNEEIEEHQENYAEEIENSSKMTANSKKITEASKAVIKNDEYVNNHYSKIERNENCNEEKQEVSDKQESKLFNVSNDNDETLKEALYKDIKNDNNNSQPLNTAQETKNPTNLVEKTSTIEVLLASENQQDGSLYTSSNEDLYQKATAPITDDIKSTVSVMSKTRAVRIIQNFFKKTIKPKSKLNKSNELMKPNWYVGDEPIITNETSATLTKTKSEISFEETEAYIELTTNSPPYLNDSSSLEAINTKNLSRSPTAPVNERSSSSNSVDLLVDKSINLSKETVSVKDFRSTDDTPRHTGIPLSVVNRYQQNEKVLRYTNLIDQFIISERHFSEVVNQKRFKPDFKSVQFCPPNISEISKILSDFLDSQVENSESDIPYEKLEEPCVKKLVNKRMSITDTSSSSSDVDDTEDSLSTKTVKLQKPEIAITKMQKRRDSTSKITNSENLKDYNFDEPSVAPIDNLDTDEEGIVVTHLQRDETRESSGQSDADVVIGSTVKEDNLNSRESFDFDSTLPLKGSLKRVCTIAGEAEANTLLKSVTIDESIKYKYIAPRINEVNKDGSLCLDDETAENIRHKIMAYSLSEADSDAFEKTVNNANNNSSEINNQKYDDFNVSTALIDNDDTSTETESTIVSAATKIQAATRGYLTCKNLGKNTKSLTPTGSSKVSFGNAAINESLENLVQEAAAKKIQKFYRHHYQQKFAKAGHHGKDASLENTLAQKRSIMLQRGVALRNGSSSEEASTSSNCSESENGVVIGKIDYIPKSKSTSLRDSIEIFTDNVASKTVSLPSSAKSDAAIRAKKIEDNKKRWIAMRQNSMPVQIDSEVLRVIPKCIKKKVKSAEGEKKKGRRRLFMN